MGSRRFAVLLSSSTLVVLGLAGMISSVIGRLVLDRPIGAELGISFFVVILGVATFAAFTELE